MTGSRGHRRERRTARNPAPHHHHRDQQSDRLNLTRVVWSPQAMFTMTWRGSPWRLTGRGSPDWAPGLLAPRTGVSLQIVAIRRRHDMRYPPIWRTSLQASMAVWVAPERAFCVPVHADVPGGLGLVQPVLCPRMPGYVVDGETCQRRRARTS